MNKTILDAINSKHFLRIEYHGYHRLVEPHTYGLNKKRHEILSCYQVAGGSKSNETEGWKLLSINEIQAISMTNDLFLNARHGYKRNTETIPTIYAQL